MKKGRNSSSMNITTCIACRRPFLNGSGSISEIPIHQSLSKFPREKSLARAKVRCSIYDVYTRESTLNVCTVRFHEGTLLHPLTTEQRFIKAKCLQSLPPSSRQEERISFVSQIFFSLSRTWNRSY